MLNIAAARKLIQSSKAARQNCHELMLLIEHAQEYEFSASSKLCKPNGHRRMHLAISNTRVSKGIPAGYLASIAEIDAHLGADTT